MGCVTQRRSDGTCWRRKDCVPSQWTSDFNTGYDVYLKRYSPAPVPVPVPPPPPPTPAPWRPSASSFELRWKGQANTCMDVAGGSDEDFTKIWVWECGYPENQRFYFDRIDGNSYGGRGQIRWAKDPSKCLDVKDGNTNNFADVVLYSCHSSDNPDFDHQVFDMPVANLYSPFIKWKSKCLDLNDGLVGSSSQPNSKVITYDCHAFQDPDWVNQQWNVEYSV